MKTPRYTRVNQIISPNGRKFLNDWNVYSATEHRCRASKFTESYKKNNHGPITNNRNRNNCHCYPVHYDWILYEPRLTYRTTADLHVVFKTGSEQKR